MKHFILRIRQFFCLHKRRFYTPSCIGFLACKDCGLSFYGHHKMYGIDYFEGTTPEEQEQAVRDAFPENHSVWGKK